MSKRSPAPSAAQGMNQAEESGTVETNQGKAIGTLEELHEKSSSKADAVQIESSDATLSKRQQKKLQKRLANEANKEAWRARQREKRKANRLKKRFASNIETVDAASAADEADTCLGDENEFSLAPLKKKKRLEQKQLHFAIDLSFESFMIFRSLI